VKFFEKIKFNNFYNNGCNYYEHNFLYFSSFVFYFDFKP